MPRISDDDRATAKAMGLTDDELAKSWKRYCEWTVEHHGPHVLLGGKHWERWAQRDAVLLADRAEERALERSEREQEHSAYTREAVTFGAWIAQIRLRVARSDTTLTEHERAVVEWSYTRPIVDPDSKAMQLVIEFGEWDARRLRGQYAEPERSGVRALLQPAKLASSPGVSEYVMGGSGGPCPPE